jgi:Holliday junction resolvasome RuvABC endonuclease subunit
MKPRTILAIDPGLRELGYAVLCGRRYITGGVVELRRYPKRYRLPEARRHLRTWVRTHRPGVIVVEKTYRHSLPWLDAVHRITVSARRLAKRRGIGFATYAPQSVRQALLGHGWAKKQDVALLVTSLYPQVRVYLTQDCRWKERYWQNLFNAVALALHHLRYKPPSRSR